MLERQEALNLLRSQDCEENLLTHCLQTEAIMTDLSAHLDEDPQLWGLTGLLHDLDFPWTQSEPEKHGLVAAQMLQDKLPESALQAIRAHNAEQNGAAAPETKLDFALRCSESATGLISANALVRPQGMQGMKPKSLKKKMQDKSFAANVSREKIMECERLGLDLDSFFRLGIQAMANMR